MTSLAEDIVLARIAAALRTSAAELDLGGFSMSVLPKSIEQLTDLTSLDLSGNRLSVLPDWIGQLTGLRDLNVSGNQLSVLPDWIARLTGLRHLNVRGNRLSVLPDWIGQLTGLRDLNVSGNRLSVLPDWIGQLTGLRDLNVWGIELSVLPESLRRMTGLRHLNVSGNRLLVLPDWIGQLTGLRHLNVRGNRLSMLPESLGWLTDLTSLDVSGNRLSVLPDWIARLTDLRHLNVSGIELSVLPDWIGQLTDLQHLNVSGNELSVLPDWIGQLTDLQHLNVSGNDLSVLPESLGRLTGLRILNVDGNPLASPPPEVRAGGLRAVLAFLGALLDSGTVRRWESKLLIVGEAAVGKTSLYTQLTDGEYDPKEPQTHGVHVGRLPLDHPGEPGAVMQLAAWDFGGQLEYRATQRLYLTDRSLVVLVWNARRRWQDNSMEAWLQALAARVPYSPVIVVATHIDDESPASAPSIADIREHNDHVVALLRADAATGRGIDEIREEIRAQAAGLPLMGVKWPATWVAAARAVRELDGLAVTANRMREAMAGAGVAGPDEQRVLAAAMHDLGDIVHFADDWELGGKVVLRPAWLDARITQLLDSPQVAERNGVLTRADRAHTWKDLEDQDLAGALLRMMQRFDLAYMVGDDSSDDVALLVDRLALSRPPGTDQAWQDAGAVPGCTELGAVFRLKSRQAGIPTWFIARMHRYTTGLHWNRGVLLHDRDPDMPAYALVVDDGREQPTVSVLVRGRFPVRFLSELVQVFKGIVQLRYPDLIEAELVPCGCRGSGVEPCGHLFPMKQLLLEANDTDPDANHKVRCPVSEKKIDARPMLHGIQETGIAHALEHLREQVDQVGGKVDRVGAQGLAVLETVRVLAAARARAGEHCPSLFDVEDLGRTGALRRYTVRIRMWCEWPYGGDAALELPGGPHPLPGRAGVYELHTVPEWLKHYLPYLRILVAGLGAAAPVITPGLFAATKELTEQVTSAFETTDKVLDAFGDGRPGTNAAHRHLLAPGQPGHAHQAAELPADFRTLRHALLGLDSEQRWGGLNPATTTEDRNIIYVCDMHYRALQYPYTGR